MKASVGDGRRCSIRSASSVGSLHSPSLSKSQSEKKFIILVLISRQHALALGAEGNQVRQALGVRCTLAESA